uniref:DOMON domain-containing protein n=1 Tax=Panagrolaimus sp. PS1159 TaxID=55785 RepID=A0AC35ER15_9BILA
MNVVFLIFLFAAILTESDAICRYTNGQYDLSWVVDHSDNVHFQLIYRNFPRLNAWTGVAFGQSMGAGLDAVIVKVINGKVIVSDEYVRGYSPSQPDYSQDTRLQTAEYNQGTLKARFTRPVSAVESVVDHSLKGCTPWHFITGPGIVYGNGGGGKHTRHPVIQIICLDQCRI